jgi:hypothetical protein
VNMHRRMFIAVEKETIAILLKYFWHIIGSQ